MNLSAGLRIFKHPKISSAALLLRKINSKASPARNQVKIKTIKRAQHPDATQYKKAYLRLSNHGFNQLYIQRLRRLKQTTKTSKKS